MNRRDYFNYIEGKLSTLAYSIEVRGKLNILDTHGHSEDFYLHFLNELFDWQSENLNGSKQNVEAIDLIDRRNKIVIQVSATATKDKIEKSLSKDLSKYRDYRFKFLSISKDASKLRGDSFRNPHQLKFDPEQDILDVISLLNEIRCLKASHSKRIYELVKDELGGDVTPLAIETNLARIVNILAKEAWDQADAPLEIRGFDIDKKIEVNELQDAAKGMIEDYKIYHGRMEGIYAEFSREGVNKSHSVLLAIRNFYHQNKTFCNGGELFFKVFDDVKELISEKSSNYEPIPLEELELCVGILIVDSFIRCKIFENPVGYTDATS